MKKVLFSILTIATSCAFADEAPGVFPSSLPYQAPKLELVAPKQGYFYLRFATAESDLAHSAGAVSPGLGLGYRRLAGDGAIDFSINGSGSSKFTKSYWTLPKCSYFHYLEPHEKKSAYIGGGLSWGGVEPARRVHFVGIIPHATVGYEFAHKSALLGFAELNVSQPAIPLSHRGRFPGPIAELSVGAGF